MKKLCLFVLLLCAVGFLKGCGGGGGSTVTPPLTPPPASATHFSISAQSSATAGAAFKFTVTALDASNNTVASYSGTVHFTSSDANAVLPQDSTLTSGAATFQITLNTAGSQTITGTDTSSAAITGTSKAIVVSAAATHFVINAPAVATTGASFNFSVTALDALNDVVATYAGTVHYTSTDAQAALPADSKLTNGSGTLQATLKTEGSQTLSATDRVKASITGTSNTINASGSATHLSVTAPMNASVGTAFAFTVTALDALNNVSTGYSGTVHITSTDGHAELPADSGLTNGIANLPAGLKTTGSQTITATDTVASSITGISNAILVSAASAVNPAPFINQPLRPGAVVPGGGDSVLTVDGTGFVPGSIVNWNGKTRSTSYVSASKLTATVLAADVASFKTASVSVVSPGPGGGSSNAVFFEITRPTSSVALGSPAKLNAGSSPSHVATGDFNGDGKLDLIVANFGSNDISVLLGNGDGTFQPAVNYGAGAGPRSIGVGDFNGDGKLDLAVVNTNSNNVSVLLGNGDGTFQPAVNYAAGSGGQSVAIGDLNGDGKLDLVVANNQSNNVSVLLGNGDGTFQAALSYPAGSGVSSVAVGDFNGDGNLDLAVANFGTDNVSILLGNGDGTFQPAVNYAAGGGCQSIVVGDFNGDGKLDLAVANIATNNVSVLLGKGDGTFQSAMNIGVGVQPESLVEGDFNGDGLLDLAVGNGGAGSVSILLGIGDGTFQPTVNYDTGTVSQWVTAGDFNSDGRLDVAVANGGSSTVSILLQPGLVSGPNATWSFPDLTFGSQIVSTVSSAQSIMLVNYGTATLNITSIAASANFAETNTCASSIAPGASCTALVTFSPSTEGTLNGALAVTDNAAGSPQTVTLSGTCVGPGCIPQGGECFGPGPNNCCPAPRGHHSFCSNPTGFGTCTED